MLRAAKKERKQIDMKENSIPCTPQNVENVLVHVHVESKKL